MKIYASWNGATEVATWQVLAGRPKEAERIHISPPKKASKP